MLDYTKEELSLINMSNPIIKAMRDIDKQLYIKRFGDIDQNKESNFKTQVIDVCKFINDESDKSDDYLVYTWRDYKKNVKSNVELQEELIRFLLDDAGVDYEIRREESKVLRTKLNKAMSSSEFGVLESKDISFIKELSKQLKDREEEDNTKREIVVTHIPEPEFFESYDKMLNVIGVLYKECKDKGNLSMISNINTLKDDSYIKLNGLFSEIENYGETLQYAQHIDRMRAKEGI